MDCYRKSKVRPKCGEKIISQQPQKYFVVAFSYSLLLKNILNQMNEILDPNRNCECKFSHNESSATKDTKDNNIQCFRKVADTFNKYEINTFSEKRSSPSIFFY